MKKLLACLAVFCLELTGAQAQIPVSWFVNVWGGGPKLVSSPFAGCVAYAEGTCSYYAVAPCSVTGVTPLGGYIGYTCQWTTKDGVASGGVEWVLSLCAAKLEVGGAYSGLDLHDGKGGCACPPALVWAGPTLKCVYPSQCPANTSPVNGECMPNGIDPKKNAGSCPAPCQDKGNPINSGTGNKFQREADYGAAAGLSFERYYNSIGGSTVRAGVNWTTGYDRNVVRDGSWAIVTRDDGKAFKFNLHAAGGLIWDPEDTAVDDRLTPIGNASNVQTGWKYINAKTEEVEQYAIEPYGLLGRLTSITTRNGQTQTLTYSTAATPVSIAPAANLLIAVADHYGRTLSFTYDSAKRIATMTDPQGGVYTYEYDGSSGPAGANNLTKVTRPGGGARIYHYNEAANTGGANLPNALTGITDETGNRYAIYQYDASGRAVSTEHAGGVGKVSLTYDLNNAVTTVTDTLNVTRTSGFAKIFGVAKQTTVTGQPCPTCGPPVMTYDANGNLASRTDWNGSKTCMAYDPARNLETRRVEGLPSSANCATYLTGTPTLTAPVRMVSTVWSSDWRLPVQIAEPLRITTYTYGAPTASNPGDRGNVLSRTVQGTTDVTGALGLATATTGSPRTSTTTYNANGSIFTMDGPRTDASDLTTYTYYANNDSDLGKRGNVAAVMNALGHATTITSYNAHGQPTGITDPNGLSTTLTYDSRLRLTARNVGGEITSYQYDGVGQLTQVSLPDGSQISYTYDAAHRLTGMADNLGNRIAYTLDLMGNRTTEEVFDPANQLAQKRSRVYNALNRLTQDIGASNQTSQYAYDNQGNLITVTDPLNRVTTSSYDALNRLMAMTQPQITLPGGGTVNPVIAYGYDGLDHLVSVTDPRSLVTSYTYDGLGNMSVQQSPDTGGTTATFDAAGNVLTRTDSAGRTSTQTYDALNRVITASHAQSGQPTVSYTYTFDQGANAKGRLTQIAEVSGNISYAYDQHGRVTSETRGIAGTTATTAYAYDAAGRLNRITYPSGRLIDYSFDALGRIAAVTTRQNANSAAQTVVSNVSYHPFRSDAGGVTGFTLGNGRVHTRSVDQDGRIASYSQAGQPIAIAYDVASNITGIGANTYGYDALNRLTSANAAAAGNFGYAYDATGNRTQTTGANPARLTVDLGSNRLTSIQTTGTRTMQYDPAGAITNDGNAAYGYDVRNRMVSATVGGNATLYEINALGERVRKSSAAGGTLFHYDRQGKLIAETNAQGQVVREIIYLLDLPVGVFQ